MRILVDLRDAGIEGVRFAIWCQAKDGFISVNGIQGWSFITQAIQLWSEMTNEKNLAIKTVATWRLGLLIGISFAVVGEVNGTNNQVSEILELRSESRSLAGERESLLELVNKRQFGYLVCF